MCLPFSPQWSKAGSKGRISLLQCGYNIWACLNPRVNLKGKVERDYPNATIHSHAV